MGSLIEMEIARKLLKMSLIRNQDGLGILEAFGMIILAVVSVRFCVKNQLRANVSVTRDMEIIADLEKIMDIYLEVVSATHFTIVLVLMVHLRHQKAIVVSIV
jgi:hypothetical protein